MGLRDPAVDDLLARTDRWRDVVERLRALLLDEPLVESLKWRQPCYSYDGVNVAIIQGFKATCCLMFFNGVALPDPAGLLEAPGPNTRVARRVAFHGVADVLEHEAEVRTLVSSAIRTVRHDSGRPVARDVPLELPSELRDRLGEDPQLQAAFDSLTPGRQRAYVLHISAAKKEATRSSRVDRCIPRIRLGKGFRDPLGAGSQR